MKQEFTAATWQEGDWFVAQCIQVDVASQGESEEEALANLEEALRLHFKPPRATRQAAMHRLKVEVGAA